MLALPPEPEHNEAFLREVEEEYRRDQITGFWRRWRVTIIGGVVLGLASLGGWEYWQHNRAQQAEADGQLLDATLTALGAGNFGGVTANLAKLEQSHVAAYRASALMTEAAVAMAQNKQSAAIAKYAVVLADDSLPRPFRDAALVRQTALEYDTMAPQAVIDRLKPLAIPGNAWFGSAGEMTALALVKLNKTQEAATMFAAIAKDEQVPASLRRRATQMAGSLGVDALGEVPGAEENNVNGKDKGE